MFFDLLDLNNIGFQDYDSFLGTEPYGTVVIEFRTPNSNRAFKTLPISSIEYGGHIDDTVLLV